MTDWEMRYRNGDTPWDKGVSAPPLDELIGRHGVGLFGDGTVCVPGCGAGHDVRLLASHGLRAIGVDVADAAIRLAESFPPVAEERYQQVDFFDAAALSEHQVSALWEHTCYCAIDPARRGDYARSAAALLPAGGILAGVFFLTPYDLGELAEGPPFAATVEEIDACFEPWFERIDGWVPETGYPGRVGREWLAVYRRLAKRPVAGCG